jgi:hypothetical protein
MNAIHDDASWDEPALFMQALASVTLAIWARVIEKT